MYCSVKCLASQLFLTTSPLIASLSLSDSPWYPSIPDYIHSLRKNTREKRLKMRKDESRLSVRPSITVQYQRRPQTKTKHEKENLEKKMKMTKKDRKGNDKGEGAAGRYRDGI